MKSFGTIVAMLSILMFGESLATPLDIFKNMLAIGQVQLFWKVLRDHSINTYEKFSQKVTFLTL